MYPGWLPLLGGQSVPEGSRNPVVAVTNSRLVDYCNNHSDRVRTGNGQFLKWEKVRNYCIEG